MTHRLFLSDILVDAKRAAGTFVVLGDSITDGAGATLGADTRWSDFFAARAALHGIASSMPWPIQVFNQGRMRRDFTYIDDIVAGVLAALDRPPVVEPGLVPFRLYNLGNSRTEPLGRFIEVMERAFGSTAEKVYVPMQPGDVVETSADITASRRDLGFDPKTSLDEGLPRFADWYRTYRNG